ncbi:MAG TPA: type I-E CRISPR-associated protein Cse1/CasA [Verrucomicrobiales bacterium]|nr:type I-E CRISPR-associated protein Cse1/CasA [Verrucomicrobiales bacterium]
MNLIHDPWIPALCPKGKRELYSLQDLFAQAHELLDISAKPHERIALMRLLLCITQAALDGPMDEAEWEGCSTEIQPRARDYLGKWKEAFELFGDGPRFLQLDNLQSQKEPDEGVPASKLDLTLATGNNSTLFDNVAGCGRALLPASIAINLVTFQCFSPGGRIGVARWNGKDTPGKGSSNHAPCTPSSMVHGFVCGEDLLTTIHRNLVTRATAADVYGAKGWGRPVWEFPCHSESDRDSEFNATRTYLGRLVPLSRAIRLEEDGRTLLLANGLDYPIYPAFREASATIVTRKAELALLPASTSRSLWRQLAAISVQRRASQESACGPLALEHAPQTRDTKLWVGALVTDKAKIEDVVESTYALPAGMFSELGRAAYERGVGYAEERESALIQGIKAYASALKMAASACDRARQQFWTRAEQNLSKLFDLSKSPDLVGDLPTSAWGAGLQKSVLAVYEQFCPRQSPRQIEAYALGLRKVAERPRTHHQHPDLSL